MCVSALLDIAGNCWQFLTTTWEAVKTGAFAGQERGARRSLDRRPRLAGSEMLRGGESATRPLKRR